MLLLAALTVLAYRPALQGAFVFDDELVIRHNVHVHGLDRLDDVFSSSLTAGAGVDSNFYRPLQSTLYALAYSLFGAQTTLPYHLLSLGFHLSAGGLLAACLLQFGFGRAIALIATGVFWLHPLQSQAVAYISGLGDPLAANGMFGSLLLFLHISRSPAARHGWLGALGVLLLMQLALLSKENAVVLAPLLVVAAWFHVWRHGYNLSAPARAALLAAIALAGVWSVLKLTVLNFTGVFGLSMIESDYTRSLAVRLITFVHTIWDYAVLAVWPADLFYDKPLHIRDSLASARGVFGLGIIALLGWLGWQRQRFPRAALGAGMLAVPMIPYLGLVPLNAGYLEHWLYLPMAGIGLLIALGVAQVQQKLGGHAPWLLPAALCGIAVLATGRIAQRSAEWADPEAFYRNELAHGAHSIRVYNNLGKLYAERGDLELAERHFRQAISLQGNNRVAQAHHNLALIQAMRGDWSGCLAQLRQALELDPRFLPSLQLLQRVQAQRGDPGGQRAAAEAIEAVRRGQAYRLDTLGLP